MFAFSFHRKAGNAGCSKNAKTRSAGSSPVRDESDYGASTEEEEEKVEQPSTSAIKTSTRGKGLDLAAHWK